MNEEMRREIDFHPKYEIELILKDADNNSKKQVQDIRELAEMDLDLLIVSPNEAEPLSPVVEHYHNSGLPIIVIDRTIK